MRAAFFIAHKDLRLLLRSRMALFWAMVFPVVFALFMGSVLSSSITQNDARLRVAFVDQSGSDAARRFRAKLVAEARLAIEDERDTSSAEQSVRSGRRLAFVRLGPDFPTRPTELGVDPARASESALVRAALTTAALEAQAPPNVTVPPLLREVPVLKSGAVPNAFALVFPAAVAWGLMGCAATFAISMVVERTGGTLIRLRAAPIGKSSLVLGKAIACAIACLVDAALLLLLARLGFGVTVGSPLGLALALASLTVCFVGLTLFLSTLGSTEQAVSGAGWATLLFLAMIGGAMVPLSFMPEWMQRLGDLSPIRWGVLALEGALWRGSGPRELLVPCAVLLGFGVAGTSLGIRLTARRVE